MLPAITQESESYSGKFGRTQGKLFHDESSQQPALHELGFINVLGAVMLFWFGFDHVVYLFWVLLHYFKLNLSAISFVKSGDKT